MLSFRLLLLLLLLLLLDLLAKFRPRTMNNLAQSEMCRNSSGMVDELIEGTTKYESSAYLSKASPVCNAQMQMRR